MRDLTPEQGYFSVLRWRTDATRDEAKNVAIVLVDEEGTFGAMRHAPVSTISPRLQEQGILDALLVNLESQMKQQEILDVDRLTRLHEAFDRSLVFTAPRRTAIYDREKTLRALYRAYVAPRVSGGSKLTKGKLLDKIVAELRKRDLDVQRGQRYHGFQIDVILSGADSSTRLLEVVTFATANVREPIVAEHDAGHFLYALDRLDAEGIAIVAPPSETAGEKVFESYRRVMEWFEEAEIQVATPESIPYEDLAAIA